MAWTVHQRLRCWRSGPKLAGVHTLAPEDGDLVRWTLLAETVYMIGGQLGGSAQPLGLGEVGRGMRVVTSSGPS